MTFDQDYVSLRLPGYRGALTNTCKEAGLDWPPPLFIKLRNLPMTTPIYRRVELSDTPDGDAARGVKRVAVYEHDHDEPAERKRGPKDKMEASNG